VREGIASDDPTGQLLLTVLAGVAQLERDLIAERTRAGLRAARLRGSAIGRPQTLITRANLERIEQGQITKAELARELGCDVSTIFRRLQNRG